MSEGRARDEAIDALRGAVMVLMALDHTRDFWGDGRRDPTDLATTSVALFMTRWVTHFCAPVFVLLAGVSAWMSSQGRSASVATRALVTRGLWLVLLELTVVRFGWLFNVDYRFSFVQVIWAIGWSMVCLAALARLGTRGAALVGGTMVLGHNLLDGVHADRFGAGGWLWKVLHDGGRLEPVAGHRVFVAYPLVPWVGVMALGFAMGPWTRFDIARRRRALLRTGAALTAAFVLVRGLDVYGDASRWSVQARAGFTALSFVRCTKYPPSLDYLLMTLGPALMVWGALTGRALGRARALVTLGRVPLFFYVVHLPLLHAMAGVWLYAHGGLAAVEAAHHSDAGTGGSLPLVYAAWAVGIALLWPMCRWFDGVKTRHRGAWWTAYT